MSMSNCHEKDIYKYKTFCTWESEPNNSKKQVLERKKTEIWGKQGKDGEIGRRLKFLMIVFFHRVQMAI